MTGGRTPLSCCSPSGARQRTLGHLLGALVAAGALAAFLSTSSGLLTSVAGVVFTDVLHADRTGSVPTSGSPPYWPRWCR